MNQRKFFINQQRVKHCLWQKSQKFDHYFFFRLCRYLHHPIFFMDGMTNFERGLVINSSSKQKKCFNFTNFFLCTYCKGPSINDVTHNLRFLIPPSSSIGFWSIITFPQILLSLLILVTSFMDSTPSAYCFQFNTTARFSNFFSEKTCSVLVVVIFSTTALAIC